MVSPSCKKSIFCWHPFAPSHKRGGEDARGTHASTPSSERMRAATRAMVAIAAPEAEGVPTGAQKRTLADTADHTAFYHEHLICPLCLDLAESTVNQVAACAPCAPLPRTHSSAEKQPATRPTQCINRGTSGQYRKPFVCACLRAWAPAKYETVCAQSIRGVSSSTRRSGGAWSPDSSTRRNERRGAGSPGGRGPPARLR